MRNPIAGEARNRKAVPWRRGGSRKQDLHATSSPHPRPTSADTYITARRHAQYEPSPVRDGERAKKEGVHLSLASERSSERDVAASQPVVERAAGFCLK